MEIKKTNPAELLDNCKRIKIPFYQRDYSWDIENVQKLLNDIYESKTKSYFLGSIILKVKGRENTIIDGQQRISTIILIYKVIWNNRKLFESKIENNLDNLLKKIKFDSANLKDGKLLLEIVKNEEPEKSFNEKITQTKYFENYQVIKKFIDNKPNKEQALKKLYTQLEKVVLSEVITDDDVDEHILFSQINSTGKILSAFDLAKNFLFSHISIELEGDEKKGEEISKMLDKLETVSDLKKRDDAIRHFIAFETGNLPNRNSMSIYKSLIKLYENDYKNNAIKIFNNLHTFFFYYSYLEKKQWEKNDDISPMLNTLIESFKTYAVLIIFIFHENSEIIHEKLEISNQQTDIIKKSLLILESYKFKREFCEWGEKAITRFIPDLTFRIIRTKNNEIFKNLETDTKLYYFLIHEPEKKQSYRIPNENEFKEGMDKTKICNSSKKTTKSFLYRLSSFKYKDRVDYTRLTIEHILPQKYDKWISNGYNEAEKIVDLKINTIGNLTLTTYNSELSNNPFAQKKKDIFESKDSFPLNKYITNNNPGEKIEKWNIEEIEKRSKWLFDICQDIWSFDEYKKIINERHLDILFVEDKNSKEKTKKIDYFSKNSKTFDTNKAYFKNIKDLINNYYIELVLRNLMVYGFGTEKNEFEVFDVEKKGWVSQSIYDFLDIASSEVKGKYDQNQFDDFIKSTSIQKKINYFIEYVQEQLN